MDRWEVDHIEAMPVEPLGKRGRGSLTCVGRMPYAPACLCRSTQGGEGQLGSKHVRRVEGRGQSGSTDHEYLQ